MKRNSIQHSKPGFTLTELLVVIVIVITLAAVSFSAINGMRKTARTALALGNLRQLSVAAHSFADDQYDILPCTTWENKSLSIGETYWWSYLTPYLNSPQPYLLNGLFRDPASPEGRKFDPAEYRTNLWGEISYLPWYDRSTDWSAQVRGIKRNKLKDASRQPYLSTWTLQAGAIDAVMDEANFKSSVLPSAVWRDGAILVLYCDSSAVVVDNPVYKKIAPFMR